MEYITVEQFLEQPVEVQKAFIEWWKANESETDLVCLFLYNGNAIRLNWIKIQECNLEPISEIIPLLVEGQLRKFIEDKTYSRVSVTRLPSLENKLTLSYINNTKMKTYINLGFDLLQSYWKVATQIAKDSIS